MSGFNHPKGQGLCCFHTLPKPLQQELIEAGVIPSLGMKVFIDPTLPSGVVQIRQNGKTVGSIVNVGAEGERDER